MEVVHPAKVDVLAGFGVGFLGTRLKRLAERLLGDAAQVAQHLGLPVQPTQVSLLMAIHMHGPISVSDLAERLQLSQPTVSRALAGLTGFVRVQRSQADQRAKRLTLTKKGDVLVSRIQTVLLPRIERAAASLVAGEPAGFMAMVARVESRLAEASLLHRVEASGQPATWVRDFSDELAGDFYRINAEWIESMFALEENDIALLSRPRELILDKGGLVLFAETPDLGVVGTCALMVSEGGWVELTKMGVLESARGRKIGEFLLAQTLERAASAGFDKVYLLTNKKCAPAIHLYEKLGFVHDREIARKFGCRYERCDVAMSYRPREL
jgi:DNA-binding MarR family transcriptional regulator/GNAT superfamily N-acetyltransferase